jgi:hypothetical protein
VTVTAAIVARPVPPQRQQPLALRLPKTRELAGWRTRCTATRVMKQSPWIQSLFSLALSLAAFGCAAQPETPPDPPSSPVASSLLQTTDGTLPVGTETTCHCYTVCADTGVVYVGVSRNYATKACIAASQKCVASGCSFCEPHDDEAYCD